MPADDTMLAQGTVDFRNEERKHVHSGACIYTYPDCDEELAPSLSFCTQDAQCRAEADQHSDGCPVEEQLTNEFGF